MSSPAPALSLVIPAYNEEAEVESALRRAAATLSALALPYEILLVNDGSVDRTGAIADRLAGPLPGLRVFHQKNQGIGGAFRTGVQNSRGRYIALWPVDMPCTPQAVAPFTAAMGKASVIVGCRRRRVGYNPLMRANALIYPYIVYSLFGLRLRDVNWICFYDGERLRGTRLTQSGIPMLAEILVRMRDAGATFEEVDVDMIPRRTGVPSAARFKVMRHTLWGLFHFYRTWRRESEIQNPTPIRDGS
jgi:glycosyltransferase involved in cell wall biosynthesis